jgi:hypothetical protein
MEKFEGYLVLGSIKGQGTMYLDTPTCIYVEVVYDGKEYVFFNGGKEIFRASRLSGQWWEIEFDSFDNKWFNGEYWDFLSEQDVNFIYENVLSENESFTDWLREKYEGWGL